MATQERKRTVAAQTGLYLLVVAGILEGFFSPSHAPVWLKFTVGGLLFILLNLWLFHSVKAPPAGIEAPSNPATLR